MLIALMVSGAVYFQLFYKTWDNKSVPRDADIIIAIDTRRIINTVIWELITTPSQWKIASSSAASDSTVSWDDMVTLPDYVFIFHPKGFPGHLFYTVLQVKDEKDFGRGLVQYHFTKTAAGYFVSEENGIVLFRHHNNLLLGTLADSSRYIEQVADELFRQQQFIREDALEEYVKAGNHLTAGFPANSLLSKRSYFNVNFDKNGIHVKADLQPKNISLTSQSFSYCDSSLLSMAFSEPGKAMQHILPGETRTPLSKAVNFNIDSLMLPSNSYYQLDISGIYPRTDSAVTYTYDDNFNPVETKTVNTIEEPAFVFVTKGDSIRNVFNYWLRTEKLEKNGNNYLFTPIPFAKTFCTTAGNELQLKSAGYKATGRDKTINCLLFIQLLLTKLPASTQRLLPAPVSSLVKNVASAILVVKQDGNQLTLTLDLNKLKKDRPLFE